MEDAQAKWLGSFWIRNRFLIFYTCQIKLKMQKLPVLFWGPHGGLFIEARTCPDGMK